MILQAAGSAGAAVLYSEDLAEGQTYLNRSLLLAVGEGRPDLIRLRAARFPHARAMQCCGRGDRGKKEAATRE